MAAKLYLMLMLAWLSTKPAGGIEPRQFAVGNLEVSLNDRGQFSIHLGDHKLVNYEALQLIDNSVGWKVVYSEGVGSGPTVEFSEEGAKISHDVAGKLSCTKTVRVAPGEVSWKIEVKIQPNSGGRWCYYFLDLPAALLRDSIVKATAGGETTERLMSAFVGGGELFRDVSRLTFVAPAATMDFELTARNAVWLLTDWSGTQHESYRLRIERLAEKGFEASMGVTLRVSLSDQRQLFAAKAELARRQREEHERLMREAGFVQNDRLAILGVEANSGRVPRRAKLELGIDLAATFDNPFDTQQIDLRAEVTAPSGAKFTVPGFFMHVFSALELRPFRAGWKVRFSPGEVGRYQYAVVATDQSGTVRSAPQVFECVESESEGYVRVAKANPHHFELESGAQYLPIGINLFVMSRLGSPPPADRLDRCLKLIERLADSGGNFVRLRMDSWWNAIEGPPDPVAGYLGPGWYQMQTAWELDRIYELAEHRGIRIMHCVDNANANVNNPLEEWRRPYNFFLKEFGGPCGEVNEFWTHPEAIRLFRNRLRYCVARWGYSASAMCWEFWNEYACRKSNIDDASKWHAEMARYLREVDPYDHPITTSIMGDASLHDRIWSLLEMDINQLHTYVRSDQVAVQRELITRVSAEYDKPFFIGETGIVRGFGEGRYEWDPDGLHLHNSLWAPAFAGSSGAGAFWYVEPYLDARDLYYHYRPLADFASDIPWNSADLTTASVSTPVFETLPTELHFTDFTIPAHTKYAFDNKPHVTTFDIRRDGGINNVEMIRPFLYCNEGRKAPPSFQVHYDRPGEFVVHVTQSVGNDQNRLLVRVDGKQAIERPFPAGRDLGKGSNYVEQYDNWKTAYDERVVIPVPAGDHEICPEAVGKDRLEVSYSLTNYQCFETSDPLRIMGVATRDAAWLWVQNRLSNWTRLWGRQEVIPVLEGATATISGLRHGDYKVEWWDTWKGGVTSSQRAHCTGGMMQVTIPRVDRDVACRITRE